MSCTTAVLGLAYLRLGDLYQSRLYATVMGAMLLLLVFWFGRHHGVVRTGFARLAPHRRRQARGQSLPPGPEFLPPAIVMDGEANALSVARDLSAMGVRVYALGDNDSSVRYSRHVQWIDVDPGTNMEAAWARFLLSDEAAHLAGAVLLGCSDAALEVLATHRDALRQRYHLDLAVPEAQKLLLDKQRTYELARAAGVNTPKWWSVQSRQEIEAIRHELVYPLIVKPRLSHLFDAHFGRKFLIAENEQQLLSAWDTAAGAGLEMMLVEQIPGGDDKLCSYFTYLDEAGTPLFHYTKRVIRRYPTGMGAACYHITDWIPELIAPANRLLDQAGMRGLANVEFKLDERDGQYKLIECNARFVASNALVSASGFPLAQFVYNRITNRPSPPLSNYRRGMRMWDPLRDLRACRELRQMGLITYRQWLRSVMHRHTFAYFRWTDPLPALSRIARPLRRALKRNRQ